jgi:beta-aspartyl-peptidase (threonine type)
MFEDSPLFNAGRGSVYTRQETHEMDASVMNGATLAAGAVACVHGVKNPVLAARAVMEHSRHVLLVGEGAMDFLRQQGLAFAPESYFHTEHRLAQLRDARDRDAFGVELDHDGEPDGAPPLDEKDKLGTVGAVALDARGDLAAATSTGGMTNKLAGRVGDSPIIGAGCYADRTAAVSCTGDGEYFMRLTVARDVAARMQYLGLSLRQAGLQTLDALTALGGRGGFIAVDRRGEVMLPFNSPGMYRGWIGPDQKRHIAIYSDSPKPD